MATTKTLNQQVYNYNIPAKCYILFHNTFVYLGNAIIILKLKKKKQTNDILLAHFEIVLSIKDRIFQ
jgi:hypothetical protein